MWNKIFQGGLGDEVVRATINHGIGRAEIIDGRRRRNAPFEGSSAPRVAVFGFFATLEAPDKIEEEEYLRDEGENCGCGDKSAKRRDERRDCGKIAPSVESGRSGRASAWA